MRLTIRVLLFLLLFALGVMASPAHAQAPGNDDLAGAATITTLPYDGTSSNTTATSEENEQPATCDFLGTKSVWWTYTPASDGVLLVDSSKSTASAGGDLDTVVSVWTGSSHPLAETKCDDWAFEGDKLSVAVTAGTPYYIRVTGYDDADGTIKLRVQQTSTPDNDSFANAVVIGALPYEDKSRGNLGATLETEEALPSCAPDGDNSVWWRYTATADGALKFDTLGSKFDTILSVWTGSGHALTEIACSDQSGNKDQSSLGVAVTQGTTYFIRVSGYEGKSGMVTLNVSQIASPANDNRASAVVITSSSYSENTRSNANATREAGEGNVTCTTEVDNSIWWSYTPNQNGKIDVSTLGSSFDTVLSLWEADAQQGLTEVACNDNERGGTAQSQLTQVLRSGTTYYIRVSGYGGTSIEPLGGRAAVADEGAVQLNVEFTPLAVTLAGFTAHASEGFVLLRWETVSEQNNAGFNLLRSTNPDGPGEQINTEGLIQSEAPGSIEGSSYEWIDQTVEHGHRYYYWLEDVGLNGVTTQHGPVTVEVNSPTSISFGALNTAESAPTGWMVAAGLLGLTALAGGILRRRARR
jgi:hypothetical protein